MLVKFTKILIRDYNFMCLLRISKIKFMKRSMNINIAQEFRKKDKIYLNVHKHEFYKKNPFLQKPNPFGLEGL